jgi:hypothetical protein
LTKYHAGGDCDDRFVRSEFAEIQETIRLEKENSKNGWQVVSAAKEPPGALILMPAIVRANERQ